jgi:hypothetical protein
LDVYPSLSLCYSTGEPIQSIEGRIINHG